MTGTLTAAIAATMTEAMRTAIVILNWNTKSYLERFLPPLLDSVRGLDAEVIVADSGSSDGSMEMMAERFPSVRRLPLGENFGFTGGYNRAFEAICGSLRPNPVAQGEGIAPNDVRTSDNDAVHAAPEAPADDATPEYFLLLNSDVEVPQGWLQPLIAYMDTHPICAACSPKLHAWQDRDMFEYAGAAGGLMDRLGYTFCRGRLMQTVERDEGQYDDVKDVFWVSGACMMVRTELFRRMGGLDGRFFAHFEEIDLCWRMQLEGWKVTVVPQSVVYHLGGGTLPSSSPWKLRLNFRNNLMTLQKNLAKTFAIGYRDLPDRHSAAIKAVRRASRVIFLRKVLDGCSAAVYLLTGHIEEFKAVLRAHKEAAKLCGNASVEEVEAYMGTLRPNAAVVGLWKHWMVPRAMFRHEGMVRATRDI